MTSCTLRCCQRGTLCASPPPVSARIDVFAILNCCLYAEGEEWHASHDRGLKQQLPACLCLQMALCIAPGVAQHIRIAKDAFNLQILPILCGQLLQEHHKLLELPPEDVSLPACQKGGTHIHLQQHAPVR